MRDINLRFTFLLTYLQHKINTKKRKPGLVASYDIRPGNGDCLFLFWCLTKSLTYLLRHLTTNLQPWTHMEHAVY